ncbi:hypothetical protein J5S49_13355 [Virgibacillus halodenitrificans]|nr:hypothetical protein [Virgibacillus halodenitrificans]MCG1029278.1 hypothetical protein [Virgibacillus halodenitrificans]
MKAVIQPKISEKTKKEMAAFFVKHSLTKILEQRRQDHDSRRTGSL